MQDTYGAENTKSYGFAIGEEAIGQQLMKFVLQGKSSATWFDKVFTTTSDYNIAGEFSDINETFSTYKVNTWDVIDPMSKWVEFEKFANDDDETNNNATWVKEDNTIKWNLEGTNYIKTDSTYTYVLSYYVKLNKNAEGFKSGEFYPTNKETTIEYGFTTEDAEISREKATFKIPTVCGFLPEEVKTSAVLPDTATPDPDGQVLPDSANPDSNSSVLGEEAKTSDNINWTLIAVIALAAFIAVIAFTSFRKKESK